MISIHKARLLRQMIIKAAQSLTDTDAYGVPELFPAWKVNHLYSTIGERLQYSGKLYKVKQSHTSQADWTPDIATSLYEEVPAPGQGDTPDNPIPYSGNMALDLGKYYSEDGVTYICIRSTGVAVHNRLADMIELYVEVYVG